MCVVCREKKPTKKFEVEFEVEGLLFKQEIKINKRICSDCFIPESLVGNVESHQINVGLELYAKRWADQWWEESDFNRGDLMSKLDIFNELKELGLINSTQENDRSKARAGRDWVRTRLSEDWGFRLSVPKPKCLHKNHVQRFITKETFNFLIKLKFKGNGRMYKNYYGSSKHQFTQEKLLELYHDGWVLFDKDLNPKFGEDSVQRLCIRCGIPKKHKDFYQTTSCHATKNGDIKPIRVWECLCCSRERGRKYYAENREDILKKVNSEEVKKKRREYAKKPEVRAKASLDKGFKRFHVKVTKGSQSLYKNKHVELSARDYRKLMMDLWEPWMNWDNYGAGKNFDHIGCWHVDHIIPKCRWSELQYINPFFDVMSSRDQAIGLNHWSNLRPLCSKKNMSRSYIEIDFQEISDHYNKLKDLYPDRGVGEINLSIIGAIEAKKEETFEQSFLNV
jgi:hypothetical protein